MPKHCTDHRVACCTGADGEIIYDLTDETWNTRFLGDLYQDLSESARKTYALLQTPEFVEEFILNYTLDPAIEEFGLEPNPPYGHDDLPHRLRVIDPACGSGHFLLGAFHRILTAWQSQSQAADKWDLISRTLESVHGVDKNPFAVAIARFRLMLAAMREGGVTRLTAKVDFPLNIAVGDSLLHGHRSFGTQGELGYDADKPTHSYQTENIDDYIKSVHILAFGSYHAVFANPPYITVGDKSENEAYRARYPSCHREYSLSVPFVERIFKLAIRGSLDGVGAGYTGQITGDTFTKREFGRKLIEEFLPQVDVTHVIDTSGAYIPGHGGTPTVILFGRWRYPRPNSTIRAVLGVNDEPGEPSDPTHGYVWQAILSQIDDPGSESIWVSAIDLPRDRFAKHPWTLGGGGKPELLDLLNSYRSVLKSIAKEIGYIGQTNADDAFFSNAGALYRRRVEPDVIRFVAVGELVRDFQIDEMDSAIFPYAADKPVLTADSNAFKWLWPSRTILGNRATFSKQTYFIEGRPWFEWHQVAHRRLLDIRSLTYAFVATHNRFVYDRSGQVGNRTAPVVKLPDTSSDNDYLAFLAILNSSTACFWLKEVCYPRGGDPVGSEGARVSANGWDRFYEFTAKNLERFPLPADLPLDFGRELDALAQRMSAVMPSAVCADCTPTRQRLDVAQVEHEHTSGRMIALQEELDWDVYRRYGLLTDDEAAKSVANPESVPELKLGERAFEIVLARRVKRGELETQWFARHRSTPITAIPGHWPQEYQDVVAKRIEIIERDRNIGLIERPECKRRWQSEPWEVKEREALTNWLLDRCEERSLWFGPDGNPRPMTVNRLADQLRADADVVSVARLLAGQDADLADVIADITADEHVPYLAQLRYTGEGLIKRAQWEQTWDLQRAEDGTGQRLDIPVPPKYKNTDFRKTSYWRQRGKLDVPKERFISYPGASPGSDDSLLLGWAGWDHREQAYALVALIEERSVTDAWECERLRPLLAGLSELMPWVRQWHGERDDSGTSPAEAFDSYLATKQELCSFTEEDLRNWTPPQPARGRRSRS